LEGGGILGAGGAGGVQDALAARARLEIARGRHEGSGVAMRMKVTALGVLMGGCHVCLFFALDLKKRGTGEATRMNVAAFGVLMGWCPVCLVFLEVSVSGSLPVSFPVHSLLNMGHVQKYCTEKK